MNREPETQEAFIVSSMPEEVRYFAAGQNGKICAFLKISATGETLVAAGNTYRHIADAYCLQIIERSKIQNIFGLSICYKADMHDIFFVDLKCSL